MEDNDHYDIRNNKYYIFVTANFNALKAVLTLQGNYQVDFTPANSIRHVLGFNSTIYTDGYHESESVVNIMNISSILVNVDIITGSHVNGKMQPAFFPNVPPGHKIIETPPHLKYLPVTLDTIASIRTYITDCLLYTSDAADE